MAGFIVVLVKTLLCGSLVMLWFELFNTLLFNLNDKRHYDFIKFIFILSLQILFIFFYIFIVLQ